MVPCLPICPVAFSHNEKKACDAFFLGSHSFWHVPLSAIRAYSKRSVCMYPRSGVLVEPKSAESVENPK